MDQEFLFDSKGNFIAFKINDYIFDTNCNWSGWMPWPEYPDIVSIQGEYLGTICDDNRLYYLEKRPLCYTGYPGYPDDPGYPGNPGPAGYLTPPPGAEDIHIPFAKTYYHSKARKII